MTAQRMIDTDGALVRCVGEHRVEAWPSPDGPMLVRGASLVIDEDGAEHPTERPVVALCRCDASRNRPWCDGMHKLLQRRDRARS